MKKLLLLLVAGMITFASPAIEAESLTDKSYFITSYTFNWLKKNSNGEITGARGFNLAVGYSSTNYFNPVKVNQFNPFWHWGTGLVFFPYIGVGGDYVFSNGFFLRGATIYAAPYAQIGFFF